MVDIRLGIQGEGAVPATEALVQDLADLELESTWKSASNETDPKKELLTLATVATVVGITSGTLSIAEKIYSWYQKYRKEQSKSETHNNQIDSVVIVLSNGKRLLLEGATTEEIRQLLESE